MARTSILKLVAVMGLTVFLLVLAVGVGAQEGNVGITIDSIDEAAFPTITLYTRVVDATRRPIPGLTANDFLILEDGVQVPASSVQVSSDTSRPLHLIFALDTSVTPETLISLQQAIKAVIASLGTQDQVAIVAHSAQPNTVLGTFASNPTILNTAVDALVIGGSSTALNETVSDAVALARTVPTAQPVILLVTDGWDAQEVFPGDVTNQALAAQVPLYAVTIGAGQTSVASAESMARQTGGIAFILGGAGEISPTFQSLQSILRQAYRISYTSTVVPDNTPHGLTLSVSHQGTRALAMGEFTAVPTTIVVRLPGLSEGQQVSGKVPLTVQAVSSSPIVSVEYYLNDTTLLTKQERAPYSYDWDTSALEAGLYRLTVRAIDEAGNVGENRLTINVASPISVQATLSSERVELGKDVTIEADVQTLTSVSRVEFLLDGRVLGIDDTVPYAFTFNSSSYNATSYSIGVRAYDALGNMDETTLPIQFLAAGSTRNWGAIGRWVLLLVGVAGAIGALLFFLRKRKATGGSVKHCYVEIHNSGNLSSRYELRAETPDEALGFHFALAGAPLTQRQEIIETTVSTPSVPGATRASSPVSSGGGIMGMFSGAADAFADIIMNVSYLLPMEAQSSLMRVASGIRRGRRTAEIAGRLTPGSRGGAGGGQSAAQRAAGPAHSNGNVQVVQRVGNTWTQTPVVEPGETLVVDLFVEALKSNPSNTYAFQIISRSLEQEGAPLVVEEATVQISKPSMFGR